MKQQTKPLPTRSKESGAILVVAMVILLVMTLLGVGSRINSVMQQKMVTAYQQRQIAELAAESALRAAETFLTDNVKATQALSDFGNGTTGLYSSFRMVGQINDVLPLNASLSDASDASLWTNGNSIAVTDYDTTAANQPRYVIEYLGRDKNGSGVSVVDYNDPNAASNSNSHVFQITAIGWSRDAAIYSVLQTTYRTGKGNGIFTY